VGIERPTGTVTSGMKRRADYPSQRYSLARKLSPHGGEVKKGGGGEKSGARVIGGEKEGIREDEQ